MAENSWSDDDFVNSPPTKLSSSAKKKKKKEQEELADYEAWLNAVKDYEDLLQASDQPDNFKEYFKTANNNTDEKARKAAKKDVSAAAAAATSETKDKLSKNKSPPSSTSTPVKNLTSPASYESPEPNAQSLLDDSSDSDIIPSSQSGEMSFSDRMKEKGKKIYNFRNRKSLRPLSHYELSSQPFSQIYSVAKESGAAGTILKNKCSICLDKIDLGKGIATPEDCLHHYCAPCLKMWTRGSDKCPLDRKSMDYYTIKKKTTDNNYTVTREVVEDMPPPDPFVVDTVSAVDKSMTCEICGGGGIAELLLICDGCSKGYHTFCIKLANVPDGYWQCQSCPVKKERIVSQ